MEPLIQRGEGAKLWPYKGAKTGFLDFLGGLLIQSIYLGMLPSQYPHKPLQSPFPWTPPPPSVICDAPTQLDYYFYFFSDIMCIIVFILGIQKIQEEEHEKLMD